MLRKDSLLQQFLDLKEAGAPGDFPNVLANVQHKLLLKAFRAWPSQTNLWTRETELTDFKPHKRTWLSEAGDLKRKVPGGPYKSTKIKDRSYNIEAETLGRTFSLLRETIINDDLEAFRELPRIFGRAASRTLAKNVVAVIERNDVAYDNAAILRAANSSSTALTANAAGITALQAGLLAIASATDPDSGEIMGLTAKYLVVSPTLAETAKWLLTATELIGSTSALANNPMRSPALTKNQQPLTLVIEPIMQNNFPSRWYLFADPMDAHAIEVGFLGGKREPDLLLKRADTIRIAGGAEDPWGYDYDDMDWKVRHDYKVKAAFYQAIYKGGS